MSKIRIEGVDVIIETFYNLNGMHIPFSENPLYGTTYRKVDVAISTEKRTIAGHTFLVDVVQIGNEPAIECELVKTKRPAAGQLVLGICQDWG